MTREWNDEIWRQVNGADNQPSRKLTALASEMTRPGATAVLDLGCGTGAHFGLFEAAGATVTGADQSPVALERAAQAHPGSQLVQVTDDSRLPLDDNQFDLVWCVDAIEHVLDTQTFISEARRLLKPGGHFVVVTPNHPFLTRLRLAFFGWSDHFDPMSPHLRFFNRRSLTDLIQSGGFELSRIETAEGQIIAVARRT